MKLFYPVHSNSSNAYKYSLRRTGPAARWLAYTRHTLTCISANHKCSKKCVD